jgi:hydrogenase-4 component F
MLCLLPVAAAIAASLVPGRARWAGTGRLTMLVGVAVVHVAIVASLWTTPASPTLGGWLAPDPLGLIVLTLGSVLFVVTAFYAVGYLARESPRGGRFFASAMLMFLASVSVVALSQHLAMLWVGMEATTLAVAPLSYHRHDRRSLEAVWKYLLISSVGIALALLGTFFLASAQGERAGRPLVLPDLIAHAHALHPAWLRASFLFLLVGYGTKMGLAPMHTWKPDTYGEAPSLVSGLMSGALTSCAFLGVARISGVVMAAGLAEFAQPVLIAFGMLSLVVAAAFVIGQSDVKRLLAYSSVEHMGLLVLGLGLGGIGAYGSVLHVLNNGLTKSWMFLVAGNVVLSSGSSVAAANRGVLRRLPVSGVLLVLGLFAVTGSPPFGTFLSEFTIVRAAVNGGHVWIAIVTLLLLAVIFVGMASLVLEMGLGAPDDDAPPERESAWLVAGPVILAAAVLMLGVYIPGPLRDTLADAAVALGGNAP